MGLLTISVLLFVTALLPRLTPAYGDATIVSGVNPVQGEDPNRYERFQSDDYKSGFSSGYGAVPTAVTLASLALAIPTDGWSLELDAALGLRGIAGEATGAFNPAFSGGGSGLGSLLGKEIRVSQRGLDLVENHLAQFESVEENAMMLERLRDALATGQRISGGDASFYLHEASEATMMGRGMTYDAAHSAALQKYGVSRFSVYPPEVIQALPGSFNQNWFNFWGLSKR